MIPLFWARTMGCLAAIASAHFLLRKYETASDPVSTQAHDWRSVLSSAAGIAALTLLPTFEPFSPIGISSVIGVWALFLAARLTHPGMTESELGAQPWIFVWGISIAAPLTIFAQTEFDGVAQFQDGLIAGLLPSWGLFFQPIAFLIALFALTQWTLATGSRSVSLRKPSGITLGLLLLTTVVVFLGAWHVPWLSDTAIRESLGGNRVLVAAVQLAVSIFKLTVLWASILWLQKKVGNFEKLQTPWPLTVASSANLVLTWALLAGVQ